MFVYDMAFELGELTVTMEEAAARRWIVSDPHHLREAGFGTHRVCQAGTTVYDLARRATQRLGEQVRASGVLVYHSALPVNSNLGDWNSYLETGQIRYLTDFPASHLQAELGLDDAFVVGVSQQACTGIFGSIRLARALLTAEPHLKQALCVSSDRVPEGGLRESTYNPLSDAAVACLVGAEERGYRVLAAEAITNGAMSLVTADEVVGSYFSYSYKLIHGTLARAGLRIEDVDYIVPQNTSVAAWQIFCSLLHFDPSRVLHPTLRDVGHLVTGCNFVNLMRAEELGILKKGDCILLPMAGYGLNWQCLLLRKV